MNIVITQNKRCWTSLISLVVAGLFGLFAVACAQAQPPAPAQEPGKAPAQPKSGGYLKHLLPYSAQNIDPYTTDDSTGYGFINGAWYEPLVKIEYTPGEDWRIAYKIIPWLAESWTQENNTTYVFKIRKGIKFHNGDDFTAHDVVFSYNRGRDPNLKIIPTVRTELSKLDKVEAVDDYTVRVSIKSPDVDFLANLAQRTLVILPKKFVEKGGDITKEAVGTGAFKLVSYRKDAEASAVKNPDYWQKGKPYLEGLKMVLRVDDSTMSAAFAAGQTDILMRNDRKQAEPILKANPKVVYGRFPAEQIYGIGFTFNRPPFNDIRVRKAMHLAIDRHEADKAVNFGDGYISGPLVVVGKTGWHIPQEELFKMPGYRQPKDQDLAEAKRLMAEAGYPNGFKSAIGYNSLFAVSPQYAEVIQAQLKKVGIELEILPWDNPTFTQRQAQGNHDLLIQIQGTMARPGTTSYNYYHSQGLFAKPIGLSDPELDKLIEAQAMEADYKKRGDIFQKIERLMIDKVYKVAISSPGIFWMRQPWMYDWADNRSSRQSIMNPESIWMDLDQAPEDRRRP